MADRRKPDERDIQRGREVAEKRKAAGISQKVLAEHLGISAQQLSKYEHGINRMSVGVYERALEFIERAAKPVNGFLEGQSPYHLGDESSPDLRTLLLRMRRDIDLCLAKLKIG